ncbi:MAG: gamma-glutamyl-gamma-aminobutyrate hydrolase [Candidatus Hydrogenedentota bacterium]
MRPLIGITSDTVEATLEGRAWNSQNLLAQYTSGIIIAGGLPVILPLAQPGLAEETARRLDGIILSGGVADIPPETYGCERHPMTIPMTTIRFESEALWLKAALQLNLPTLGICLGMQMMQVIAGGILIQDIPSERPGSLLHTAASRRQPHAVRIVPGTQLAALAPDSVVTVYSAHHQAIPDPVNPFIPSGYTEDGILEAMEDPTRGFVIGVQWHPERNPDQPDWLLAGFVAQCVARMM